MKMEVATIIVGAFEVKCYLVWDKSTSEALIIDPGDEADRIIAQIEKLRIRPQAIALTHGHGDHIGAVESLMKKYDLRLYAGSGEEPLLSSPAKNLSAA